MQKGSNDEYCKLSADSYIFESWLQRHFALLHYFTPDRKGLSKRTNIQIRLTYLSDYVFFVIEDSPIYEMTFVLQIFISNIFSMNTDLQFDCLYYDMVRSKLSIEGSRCFANGTVWICMIMLVLSLIISSESN